MATRRSTKTLAEEANEKLREKNRQLAKDLSAYKALSESLENMQMKSATRVKGAETQAVMLFEAVRVLAEGCRASTVATRQAKMTEARKLLENAKIRPPHALGFSRTPAKKKKRKKRKA